MSKFVPNTTKKLSVWLLCVLSTVAVITSAFGAKATNTDREFIEMQTSLNAMMVAMVDWSAHEVWEASYAETMTGRDWLTVKQYATQLLGAGTLVSLGGTGRADMDWVVNPEWQRWSSIMIEDTKEALRAIEAQDQEMLAAAGERLINACEGCHEVFKPTIPTEGIMHVPHHDYSNPLTEE